MDKLSKTKRKLENAPPLSRSILAWIFTPNGTKATFDYIRNIGLCAIIIFTGVYVESGVYGSPLFKISRSSAYSEFCQHANSLNGGVVQSRIQNNVTLYAEGFTERFSLDLLSEEDVLAVRRIVNVVEYRKEMQRIRYYPRLLAARAAYLTAMFLAAANFVAFIKAVEGSTISFNSGGILAKVARIIEVSSLLVFSLLLTAYVFGRFIFGPGLDRDESFVRRNAVEEHVAWLGNNEKLKDATLYERCNG